MSDDTFDFIGKERVRKASEEEHQEVEETMLEFFGSREEIEEEPQLGIFWYIPQRDELFGVNKKDAKKIKTVYKGRKTIDVPHELWWGKQQTKIDAAGRPLGIFKNDYTDIPRGRIFQREKDGVFELRVGSWIKEHPHVVDMVKDEFQLNNTPFELIEDHHWDIGKGFSPRDL